MLKHVKSLDGGNFILELFEVILFEFDYFSASGANHVVMMLAQMTMFIANGTVVKAAFMGKPETAQQFHCFSNKIGIELPAVLVKKF
jgi:hypothetical protein